MFPPAEYHREIQQEAYDPNCEYIQWHGGFLEEIKVENVVTDADVSVDANGEHCPDGASTGYNAKGSGKTAHVSREPRRQ